MTSIWGTIGNAAGFFIPIFIAAYFGATQQTDAFFLAFSLIFLISNIFSQTLETIIIPFIAENKHNNEHIGNFIGRILTLGVIVFTALLLLSLFFIKPILSFTTSLTPEDLNLVFLLSIKIAPFAILMVVSSVLAGSINAYKLFAIPAVSPAIRAIVVIIFIFLLNDKIGINAIALGYVIGEMFRFILLFFFIQRAKLFHIRLSLKIEPELIKFLRVSFYMVIGMFLSSTVPLINRLMASWTGVGNVSLLEYAEKLFMIPIIFISSGLMVTTLSHWSERFYNESRARFKSDVSRALKIVFFIGLFLTICLFIFKGYLLNLVYGYGAFYTERANDLENIFSFYVVGLMPYLLSLVYTRALTVKKKTKVLLYVSLFMVIGTYCLNIMLLKTIGFSGIALSNSIILFITYIFLKVSFMTDSRDL